MVVEIVVTIIKFVLFVAVIGMGLAAFLTLLERRQSAFAQDRLGPQRAHLFKFRGKPVVFLGLLHIAADSIKMFFKETHHPGGADKWLYRVAPLIGFVTALMTLALIPFAPDFTTSAPDVWTVPLIGMEVDTSSLQHVKMQIARLDSGLLIVLAIGSLGVYGAALAGWSSNNRFALLGGLRAVAQSISYEVSLGLALVGILIAYGTLEPSAIVTAQAGLSHGFLPNWGIFIQPLGAMLFFVAAVAETKRTPFDLPEGESEIIGYFLEYSSMGFGLFMLGEFIEIVVLSSLFVTLFLGGWQFPWLIGDSSVSLIFVTVDSEILRTVAGLFIFMIKVFFMCSLQLQLRWTLPRFRYDQLMHLGWKILLPLALVNIFVTAGLVWWDPTLGMLGHVGVALILLFVLVVVAGPRGARKPVHGH